MLSVLSEIKPLINNVTSVCLLCFDFGNKNQLSEGLITSVDFGLTYFCVSRIRAYTIYITELTVGLTGFCVSRIRAYTIYITVLTAAVPVYVSFEHGHRKSPTA